jgi:ATP-dependent NAD(P)H-hydrate dehydratase
MASSESADSIAEQVINMLSRLHVVVIGPGLGRDKAMQETCARVVSAAREKGIPFVLDADGLLLALERPELVQGCTECILTPNVVEFARLARARGVDVESKAGSDPGRQCAALANAYGGVTIVQKGSVDYISNGTITLVSDGDGGLKRSGGQGDTLTGVLGTMLAWRKAYLDRIWEHENDLKPEELLALCAFGGSAVTRECSRLAFKDKGRSMQAGDLTDKVHEAFMNVVGEREATRL